MESRDALETRDLRLWCEPTWVFGSRFFTLETVNSHGSPGGGLRTQSPSRKRASIPNPERMVQAAPTYGISLSEKRTLDLITDHPMIPPEHLAHWLSVSEGRVNLRRLERSSGSRRYPLTVRIQIDRPRVPEFSVAIVSGG